MSSQQREGSTGRSAKRRLDQTEAIARITRHELDELERIRQIPIVFAKTAETIDTPVLDKINYLKTMDINIIEALLNRSVDLIA